MTGPELASTTSMRIWTVLASAIRPSSSSIRSAQRMLLSRERLLELSHDQSGIFRGDLIQRGLESRLLLSRPLPGQISQFLTEIAGRDRFIGIRLFALPPLRS